MPFVIERLWTKNHNFNSEVICADWLDMPLLENSADIIIGDGCTLFFKAPETLKDFAASIEKHLKPKGIIILRCFVKPDTSEEPDDVFKDLLNGKIQSFDAFKWRLAASMQGNSSSGIKSSDIWKAWNNQKIDPIELSQKCHFNINVINSINRFKDSEIILYFTSKNDTKKAFNGAFDDVTCYYGSYELAERCPLMVFRKK